MKSYGTLSFSSREKHELDESSEGSKQGRPAWSLLRVAAISSSVAFVAVVGLYLLCYIIVLFIFESAGLQSVSSNQNPDLTQEPYAVGFDLSAGYGTAAISLRNGSIFNIANVVSSSRYDEVLERLSSEDAIHPTPPYYGEGYWQDRPRQWKRALRKRFGLPASEDVEALTDVLGPLIAETNSFLIRHDLPALQYAMLTVPYLPALYNEDLVDVLFYYDVKYITLKFPHFQSGDTAQWPVSHLNSAYGGSGVGLCKHFRNGAKCYEELKKELCGSDGSINALVVMLTQEWLTAHVHPICDAMGFYYAGGVVETELGLNGQYRYGFDGYWELVRDAIERALDSYRGRGNDLTVVVSHGESARDVLFQLILKKTVEDAQKGNRTVKFVMEDVDFAASRGIAEFGRRCMMLGWDCFPDLTPRQSGW